VKIAFSKSTKFLSSNKDVFAFLMVLMLLIVWIFLLCFVHKPADPPDMNKPIKVTCNDDKIKFPWISLRDAKNGIEFGTSASCGFIILSFMFRKISEKKSIIRFFFQLLLWLLSLFTGSVFAWLWVNNGPTETLAPNFLAACKPQGLDLLCSPDSHPEDWNPVVLVTCTTPPEMWIPALSNSLPPLAAVQAYLMFATVLQVIYYWKWEKEGKWRKRNQIVSALFELTVAISLTVVIGYSVISDNVANFDQEFVSGYLKCFAVACVWLAVDSFWQKTKLEPTLPRHWNDVPVNNDPTSQTGQVPANLTPPPTPSLQEPPATTGGSTTTEETENVLYQTIYPDLPPEYEYPPNYEDSVIRY
jgi:hypothetical protein